MAQLDLILKYQEADRKNIDLQRKIRDSEEYKTYRTAQKTLNSKPAILDPMEIRAEKLENEYKTLEKVIADLSETMEDFEGIDELVDESNIGFYSEHIAAVSKSLFAARASLAKLESDIKSLDAAYKKERNATIEAQKAYKEAKNRYKQYTDSMAGDAEKISAELVEIEKEISDPTDKALLEKYKEKRKAGIYPVLRCVAFESGKEMRCGGCGMNVSIAEMDSIRRGEIKECDNCGRFMYLAK